MVMQIFQIKLSLEATKNIFINSLAESAFSSFFLGWDVKQGLLRYEKRGLGLHYFSTVSDFQIHVNSIFVEYSRVRGTDPGFSQLEINQREAGGNHTEL